LFGKIPSPVKKILQKGERVVRAVPASFAENESCRLLFTDRRVIIAAGSLFGRGEVLDAFDYTDIRDARLENADHLVCRLVLLTKTGQVNLDVTQTYINDILNIIGKHGGRQTAGARIPANRRLVSNKWSTYTLLFILLITLPVWADKAKQHWTGAPARGDAAAQVLTGEKRHAAYAEWAEKVKEYWNSRGEPGTITDIKLHEQDRAVHITVEAANLKASAAGKLAEYIGGNFLLNFSGKAAVVNLYSPYPQLLVTRTFDAAGQPNTY